MSKVLFITNLLMGTVLSRFAISKLAGWDISVEAFIEMAKPMGLDPTFFRISTGIVIAAVVISYLTTAIFSLLKKETVVKSRIQFEKLATFTNLFGLLTMTGALIAEFSLRVQPKWLLVYIAIAIILLSLINIIIVKAQSKNYVNKIMSMQLIKFLSLSLLLFVASSCHNKDAQKNNQQQIKEVNTMETNEKTTLKSLLDEKKKNFELNADDYKKRIYKEGIESVENSGILDKALKVGDFAPNFTLNNALGEPVELYQYLKKGKVVLTWYRGGWCPYCNLTLHQLQLELPEFEANGANLIALTPELPDKSLSTSEKHDLKFEVLSDIGNKIGKEYGIVFKLTNDVANAYNESFGMNVYNGDESNELPLGVTYIINEDGKIVYAFLDADYRNRAEPDELTEFLKTNK